MTDRSGGHAPLRALQRTGTHYYPSRGLHLIDVENLLGTAVPDPVEVRCLRARYLVLAGVGGLDQVVIASSHLALKNTGDWWPRARYLVRSGPDGADRELLDVMDREHVAERFCRVTIASGDGAFARGAADLVTAGCQVIVVSRRAGLSARLALAVGGRVTYIDPPGARTPPPAARASQAA
ncbi:MAG TPA: hypothetical protein VME19_08030 [Streptosporangiaceae bacterium]|jgi:hypothetical protein|nr:hypothetical protein [Streptosporangiaceae bacterium]